jgi:ubiquinone/menaquinone biosynthesis C-methylase UbiE
VNTSPRTALTGPLQSQAAEAYDRLLRAPRGRRRVFRWLEARAVARALAHAHGASVLDCPCGTGRLDPLLRARFGRVVGVDRSPAMLEVYRRGHPERCAEQADAFALPFADAAFDWVVSHRLFHHLRTDEKRLALLRSLARVAREGIVLYAWLDAPLDPRGRVRHKAISRAHAERLLAEAGLALEAVHYAAWPFQPKAELVARKR